jgi:hypothetical protein
MTNVQNNADNQSVKGENISQTPKVKKKRSNPRSQRLKKVKVKTQI